MMHKNLGNSITNNKLVKGWKVKLIAEGNGKADIDNYFGLNENALDGHDKIDIEEPPAAPNYLKLSFPHQEWGLFADHYSSDMRSLELTEDKIWEFELSCADTDSLIKLRWEGINSVPKEYELSIKETHNVAMDMKEVTQLTCQLNSSGSPIHYQVILKKLITRINEPIQDYYPTQFLLYPNYPNPFNFETIISYQLDSSIPKEQYVELSIYNTKGQRVRSLVHEAQFSGKYHVKWDGCNENQQSVGSGIYICRLVVGTNVATCKIVALK